MNLVDIYNSNNCYISQALSNNICNMNYWDQDAVVFELYKNHETDKAVKCLERKLKSNSFSPIKVYHYYSTQNPKDIFECNKYCFTFENPQMTHFEVFQNQNIIFLKHTKLTQEIVANDYEEQKDAYNL